MKIIKSFEIFENRYYTYSDFAKGSGLKTPEEFYKDVKITVEGIINGYCKIDKIEDKSDPEKGIKFEVTLSTGDILHLYKKSVFRGQYVYFLNKKSIEQTQISDYLYNKLSDLEKYKILADIYNPDYIFSDDYRVYQKGDLNRKEMISLYDLLSQEDKIKAYDYLVSLGKSKGITIEEFKGA